MYTSFWISIYMTGILLILPILCTLYHKYMFIFVFNVNKLCLIQLFYHNSCESEEINTTIEFI